MRNVIKLGIALLCIVCCSLSISAQVKMFGDFTDKVTFDGKIDKKTNLPKEGAKGSLIVDWGKRYENIVNYYEGSNLITSVAVRDVLTGVFTDGKVQNATLTIAEGWKFVGTVGYEIDKENNWLVYLLLEGDLIPATREKKIVNNNSNQWNYVTSYQEEDKMHIAKGQVPDTLFRKLDDKFGLWLSDAIIDYYHRVISTKEIDAREFFPKGPFTKFSGKYELFCNLMLNDDKPHKVITCEERSTTVDENFPHYIYNVRRNVYTYVDSINGPKLLDDEVEWQDVYICLEGKKYKEDRGVARYSDGCTFYFKKSQYDFTPQIYRIESNNGDTIFIDHYPTAKGNFDYNLSNCKLHGDELEKKLKSLQVEATWKKADGSIYDYKLGKSTRRLTEAEKKAQAQTAAAKREADEKAREEDMEKNYEAEIKKLDKKYGGKASQLIETGRIQIGMKMAMFKEINNTLSKWVDFQLISIYHDGAEWENGGRYKINVKNNTIYGSTTYRVRVDKGAVSIIYR